MQKNSHWTWIFLSFWPVTIMKSIQKMQEFRLVRSGRPGKFFQIRINAEPNLVTCRQTWSLSLQFLCRLECHLICFVPLILWVPINVYEFILEYARLSLHLSFNSLSANQSLLIYPKVCQTNEFIFPLLLWASILISEFICQHARLKPSYFLL